MPEVDIKNIKVLIVEDNVHFRTLLRTILQALGVESLEEARDGAEAIEVLKTFQADLAVIDWKMDGVNGIECVRRLRRDEDSPNRFLPIIMVTGYTEESLANEARDAGAHDFLGKPISAKSLSSRIFSVLEEGRFFIETDDFFGPDRRRTQKKIEREDRRKEQRNLIDPKKG